MAEYASNAKANAGLVTGIIGTSLGALASAGGVAGLLGFQSGGGRGGNPEDRHITASEMALIRENIELHSKVYTDEKISEVKAAQAEQAVHNAASDGLIRTIQGQVMQLYTLTQLYIPNRNIAPGWGPANVMPGFPPIPPTASSGSTATPTTSTGGRPIIAAAG